MAEKDAELEQLRKELHDAFTGTGFAELLEFNPCAPPPLREAKLDCPPHCLSGLLWMAHDAENGRRQTRMALREPPEALRVVGVNPPPHPPTPVVRDMPATPSSGPGRHNLMGMLKQLKDEYRKAQAAHREQVNQLQTENWQLKATVIQKVRPWIKHKGKEEMGMPRRVCFRTGPNLCFAAEIGGMGKCQGETGGGQMAS